MSSDGAKVVIGDVLEEAGRQTEAAVNEAGGECVFVRLDVTSEEDWAQAVATAVDRFGKLDILVNNAGVSSTGGVEEITVEEWDRILNINAKGVFLGTKAAIPEMRKAGGGSIVNISSAAGIAPSPGTSAAYAASKGAVRIFTKSTAVQYARENIRCNSVHPGPIETPMLRSARGRRCRAGRYGGQGALGPDRYPGRNRLRRPVLGVGRGVLRDGLRAGHRRRQDGAVTEISPAPI